MKPLDSARALLKKPDPTVGDLDRAILCVDDRAAECDRQLATFETERESVTLAGTLADLSKLEERIRAETFARNQAAALGEALRARCETARAAERAAAVIAERDRIEGMMAAAEKEMAAYPGYVTAIRKMLGAIARADLAAEAFERHNPTEARIARAEARARFKVEPPRIREERMVWAWVSADGRVMAMNNPQDVRPDPNEPSNNGIRSTISGEWGRNCMQEIEAGTLKPTPHHVFRANFGTGQRVWPERVTLREIEEAPIVPLCAFGENIKLPSLRPGGQGWLTSDASPFGVLAALEASPAAAPAPRVRVEFIPDPAAVRRADLPGAPEPMKYDHRIAPPRDMPDAAGVSYVR